jgi:hypothetical protein
MATVKATREPTVSELLDENARDAIAVGRLIDDTRGELAQIGQRGAPGDPSRGVPATPATGQIGDALRAQIKAHAEAAATGKPANVADFERTVVDLEAEHRKLELVLVGARQRQGSVESSRPVTLRERHDELVALARQAVDNGAALLETARAAAADLAAHRVVVQEAVQLAAVGEADDQDRKALIRSFAPWTGAASATNAIWESVALLASTPKAVS